MTEIRTWTLENPAKAQIECAVAIRGSLPESRTEVIELEAVLDLLMRLLAPEKALATVDAERLLSAHNRLSKREDG